MRRLLLTAFAALAASRCGQGSLGSSVGTPAGDAGTTLPDGGSSDAGTTPGWVVAHREDFESMASPQMTWSADTHPDDGPFADNGLFFRNQGISAPAAFRASVPFGESAWLTAESYTRQSGAAFADRFAVVSDPANPANKVLRIASPLHTDATVVRPSQALPAKYRVSLRIGFGDFGDGKPGLNGYLGGETPAPWLGGDATQQNGFYWLTILDAQPRPHNNVWIHHHRKVVMDSDNNVPPWTYIWDGAAFQLNGQHPVMMFALDGRQQSQDLTGPPFLSWSANAWQPSGAIRAVDQYLSGEWYRASIERDRDRYTLQVSGKFANGGNATYTATIDARANCVWHFNNAPDAAACANTHSSPALGAASPDWPADASWPDWFMFGDPHENFYRGSVLYDDVQLEVWRP